MVYFEARLCEAVLTSKFYRSAMYFALSSKFSLREDSPTGMTNETATLIRAGVIFFHCGFNRRYGATVA